LETADTEALVGVLGPAAARIDTVIITRSYDDGTRWTIGIDEAAVIDHLLAQSGLYKEEIEAIRESKTTGELRKVIEELGDDASERHAEFLGTLTEHFSRGTADLAAIDILFKRMPSFVYFAQYDRMQGQVPLRRSSGRRTITSRSRSIATTVCSSPSATWSARRWRRSRS
jgi:hypothetical protein